MNNKIKTTFILLSGMIAICLTGCETKKSSSHQNTNTENIEPMKHEKLNIQIILGSTREGRTSDKIGNALKKITDKKTDITTEIIDLKKYNLPFLNDEIAPASRKVITDPIVKNWSDKIKEGDAFIIIVPEYNSGYPGVLKNALDILYKEWNNKPVAFVGHSGGQSGGTSAIEQLRKVTLAFQMLPISTDINIPYSWKAFDEKNNFVDKDIEEKIYKIIDQLLTAKNK